VICIFLCQSCCFYYFNGDYFATCWEDIEKADGEEGFGGFSDCKALLTMLSGVWGWLTSGAAIFSIYWLVLIGGNLDMIQNDTGSCAGSNASFCSGFFDSSLKEEEAMQARCQEAIDGAQTPLVLGLVLAIFIYIYDTFMAWWTKFGLEAEETKIRICCKDCFFEEEMRTGEFDTVRTADRESADSFQCCGIVMLHGLLFLLKFLLMTVGSSGYSKATDESLTSGCVDDVKATLARMADWFNAIEIAMYQALGILVLSTLWQLYNLGAVEEEGETASQEASDEGKAKETEVEVIRTGNDESASVDEGPNGTKSADEAYQIASDRQAAYDRVMAKPVNERAAELELIKTEESSTGCTIS